MVLLIFALHKLMGIKFGILIKLVYVGFAGNNRIKLKSILNNVKNGKIGDDFAVTADAGTDVGK